MLARLLVTLATGLAIWSLPGGAAQLKPLPQSQQMLDWKFTQTQEWIRLAKAHSPGRIDAPLRTVAGWKAAQVEDVQMDARLLHALIVAAAKGESGVHFVTGRTLWLTDLPALLGLPRDFLQRIPGHFDSDPSKPIDPVWVAKPDSQPRAEIARVMLQAALLETDLIMASYDAASGVNLAQMPSVTINIADAQRSDAGNMEPFWDTAREAMDLVEPTPRGRTVARQWYDVTSEYLLYHRDYAVGVHHLEHARDVIPGDAKLAFLLGAAFENMAASQIQSAMHEGEAPFTGGARPVLLAKAEFQFRSALLLDPDLAEARLRLAHVLALLNRPAEALTLLKDLDAALPRPDLRYFAALFTGRAQEMLGRVAEAREAFERASQLFPDSQSPRLALAQLGLRAADQTEAVSFVRGLRPVAHASATPADPWWAYDVSCTTGLSDRMTAMRAAAAEVVR